LAGISILWCGGIIENKARSVKDIIMSSEKLGEHWTIGSSNKNWEHLLS